MIREHNGTYTVTIALGPNPIINQDLINSISNWARSNDIYGPIIEYGVYLIQFETNTYEQALEAVLRFS